MKHRIFSITVILLWAALSMTAQSANDLEEQLRQIISPYKAEIGIAAIINGTDTIAINNDKQYPLMSVVKFHQALAVANHLYKHNIPLSQKITITQRDLHRNTHSPLRDKHAHGNFDITVAELLTYTLQLSDNNACDILFDRFVSPDSTDSYIRSIGGKDFAISVTEHDMHQDLRKCYNNSSSPLDAAILLETFISKPILPEPYYGFIKRTMLECFTGKDRLAKPLLDTDAAIGHKTGTGDRNAKGQIIGINDIGFIIIPGKCHYTIAVFIMNSDETYETSTKIIATISESVLHYISKQ